MNDMSSAIVPKSDQINADDLMAGDMTITINKVEIKGGQEQPVSIFFDGSDKPFRPCKSMSRVLVAAWGPDAKKYIGRSLELYRDPTVKWGGMDVGGIRIRAMTDIDAPMTLALTATKGSRKPFTVKPLVAGKPAAQPTIDAAAELATMQAAAANGTAALEAAWTATTPAVRKALANELAGLKATAAAVTAETDESSPAAGALVPAEAGPSNDAGEAAAPAQEGRDDADMGEAHNEDPPSLDAALLEIAGIKREYDLNARVRELSPLFEGDDLDKLTSAVMDRVAVLKGGG